jgi:hypothetical protein
MDTDTDGPFAQGEDFAADDPARRTAAGHIQESSPRWRTKSNEEIIREELRNIGQSYLLVWRAGVTVLPTLLLAIGFLRREYLDAVKAKSLLAIPPTQYLLGTVFMALLAYIFMRLAQGIGERWAWYATELNEQCDNPIGTPRASTSAVFFPHIFLVFPIFDLYVRAAIQAEAEGYVSLLAFWTANVFFVGWYAIQSDKRRLVQTRMTNFLNTALDTIRTRHFA